MVLDANPEDQQLAETILRAEGLPVTIASNGSEALALADDARPSAVVCDASLPDGDVAATINRLRQMCGPDLPVVLVTAAERVAEQARAIGAFSFLEKPFDPDHLLLAVLRGLTAAAR
jgi:CheY-like chemotaxis protein